MEEGPQAVGVKVAGVGAAPPPGLTAVLYHPLGLDVDGNGGVPVV